VLEALSSAQHDPRWPDSRPGRSLEAAGVLRPAAPPLTPSARLLAAYLAHLGTVRGLAQSTLQEHRRSASRLLEHLAYDTQPPRLMHLTASAIEAFVCRSGARLGRGHSSTPSPICAAFCGLWRPQATALLGWRR